MGRMLGSGGNHMLKLLLSIVAIVGLSVVSVSPVLAGGTWTDVATTGLPAAATTTGLCNPLLLTDGTVLVQGSVSNAWYKLTPDKYGNYSSGTWSVTGSLPSNYQPEWFASAVLPDGRVIVEGGEYNITCNPPPPMTSQTWVSLGAIYSPLTGLWTKVDPPSGTAWTTAWPSGTAWQNTEPCGSVLYNGGIGDAPSIVLPTGQFMLGSCCAAPAANALFNVATQNWSFTGAPNNTCQPAAAAPPGLWCVAGNSFQGEQGYTLMQNDKIMTISVWNPPNAEAYDWTTGTWSAIAPTPVTLPDPVVCGHYEIGPALGRHDGSVVAFSGHSGCTPKPNSPTAVYTPSTNSWEMGPDVPAICGTTAMPLICTTADAPASLLPNGNILFAAGRFNQAGPTHFFEFTKATTSPPSPGGIEKVANPSTASSTAPGLYNLLVLPNGHILATDYTNVAKIYAPTGGPLQNWQPRITSAPTCVAPGATYSLSGVQLNGLSQGTAYGDDVQAATNYPLVLIVNAGHVFYARTFDFTTMSIAPGKTGSTKFTVASDTKPGASTLYVIANGIHSAPRGITVSPTCGKG